VQYVAEVKKPESERINGFHGSQLESARRRIFTSLELPPALQEVLLTDNLQESLEELGENDVFVKTILNGRTPAEAARSLTQNTKIYDINFRKSLIDGGESAVTASNDPLIVMARMIAPIIRESKRSSEKIENTETVNAERIGKARFAVYGRSSYPDATQTLRLSYGTIKTYSQNGSLAPTKTTFYGLFDRAEGFSFRFPFIMPAKFIERKDKLKLSTPLNFITTCDVVGGNSGSPVVNRNGEIVGLIFDTNVEGMVGRFLYDETKNRSVAVHTAGIIESLRKVYEANYLADEIEGVGPKK
jgi:hypothetical protein